MYQHTTPPFSLALITGASSGIGAAISHLLAEKGIPLIIAGRNSESLNVVAEQLKTRVPVTLFLGDLADSATRQKLLSLVKQRTPDLIINNAGFGLYGDVLNYETSVQEGIIEVNINAVFELAVEGARALRSQKRQGVIVNISSAADRLIFPGSAVYAATKAFVTQFSLSFDFETRDHGIRVLAACPGRVKTDFSFRASGGKLPSGNRLSMAPEFAAEEIWKQIQKRQSRRVFDWKTYWGTLVLRFLMPKKWMAKILSSAINKKTMDK